MNVFLPRVRRADAREYQHKSIVNQGENVSRFLMIRFNSVMCVSVVVRAIELLI